MAQIVEFPGPEGATLDMRLITPGTDTIVHTTSSIAGKTNDKTLFRATDVADSLSGLHRVSAVDSNGVVGFGGWVNLTGIASAEHIADESRAAILAAD